MISLQVKNGECFKLAQIPFLDRDAFDVVVCNALTSGCRMLGLFPLDKNCPEKIIAVLADDSASILHIVGVEFLVGKLEFTSFANKFPQTNYFECELSENFGYIPINHPWLRPVRKQNVILGKIPYQFYKVSGDEIHEVAVGPIHAGVIEPGHFRFQCHGELVYHLEINLGYQHRGVEAMMLKANPNQRIVLSESISGDTTIANTYAHCNALEQLSGTVISPRAQVIRSMAEELERVAMHITGLGGVTNDIGLAIASSSYGRLRTLIINSLAELCGSRYGRGLFVYGGVRFDFNSENKKKILEYLHTVKNDIAEINDFVFSTNSALNRFNETGVVSTEVAKQIGLVGMAARSSGVDLDTRTNFPYGIYPDSNVPMIKLSTGDVFARAKLRALEMQNSLNFVLEHIDNLPQGELAAKLQPLKPDSGVVSMVEGWRGEVVHIVTTDSNGQLGQYKIKDPSFNNWYGLSLALRETPISDFPLCNKSFDLSYSGHDL